MFVWGLGDAKANYQSIRWETFHQAKVAVAAHKRQGMLAAARQSGGR